MTGFFASLTARWRERRERKKGAALRWIKARYHIFRVLLTMNERALEAMAEVDRLLGEADPSRLEAAVRELREIVLELADGLNRLSGNGHSGLYPRLEGIGYSLDQALEGYRKAPRGVWLPLGAVNPDLRDQAGGKAQPLASLARAGLPVPDGFVITRHACREYLRQARLEDRLGALVRDSATPGADPTPLAARARAMILASEPSPRFSSELRAAWDHLAAGQPLRMAARSSASSEDGHELSFAGQYVSVLNVTSFEAFLQAFREVLAGAFSPRALAYRAGAGLTGETLDMAVLCLRMVDARASGVLFTVDPMAPESGRMLLTAVPGLGTQAVSGRAPADVYRPSREQPGDVPAEIADKTVREVPVEGGGLRLEEITGPERLAPLLSSSEIETLRRHALRAEALSGCPQDIEWAVDHSGELFLLQSRPARLATGSAPGSSCVTDGQVLLSGGVPAAPGKAAGRLALVRSRDELAAAAAAPKPVVLALHQSLVDAASLAPESAGLLVDMGNPLDHLACLSRELGIPMITGLGTATSLTPGDWVLVDADRGMVLSADPQVWRDAPKPPPRRLARQGDASAPVRELVLPLNLTDAYGPTFSILECKSLHDMVRFIHEKAVMALFETGDAIAEDVFSLVRRLKDDAGLSFLIIDLGGGLVPGRATEVAASDILCEPLAALCRGMATPGLRWGTPPPIPGVAGLMSRSLLDARSERPVGNPNYAFVSRDYLNLNARVDYHFAMVDAVCGANPRENSIRFRFKGGGTGQIQRERRARFVEDVMRAAEFFTSRRGDMVTAHMVEGSRETVREKMEMLGRFLGFSRLLDAAMIDDEMPGRIARAFLAGDYSLDGLAQEMTGGKGE